MEVSGIGKKAADTRLLVHHHVVAFRDGEKIYVQSFIGAWVQELSKHFAEVGLLFQESNERLPQQDYLVESENIKLISLGAYNRSDRAARNEFIRRTCREVSPGFDVLAIRGITPKQMLVYNACKVPSKVFLLVGSIVDARPKFKMDRIGFITWVYFWRRLYQLKKISRGSLVLANSPKIVSELRERMGILSGFVPTNTVTKAHAVDFQVRPVRSKPELLFCGRIVPEKGIEELLMSVKILKSRGIICRLTVIGKSDGTYGRHLQALCTSYDIHEQVKFEGYIAFGDVLLDYYRRSDLYILPSWHEGFPHSIWEAAVSCTPVIVTKVGGIPGVVSEKEVSFIRTKDPEHIAEVVERLMTNTALRKDQVKAAYDLAMEYTLEQCARRFACALEQNNR